MKRQLVMVIDAAVCLDCLACQVACQVANRVPDGFFRNWIKAPNLDDGPPNQGRIIFQPGNCMQCDRPLCVEACPTGATFKNPGDGTVEIDRRMCIGCGQCLSACPYGARYRHPELRVADKCDFCAQRRRDGLEPACVSTCPTKARTFGDLSEADSQVRRLLSERNFVRLSRAGSDTQPNIFYLGQPGLTDWPREARMPAAFDFWRSLAGPVVKTILGLTGLGVLIMWLGQVFRSSGSTDERLDTNETGEGSHESH